jgi:hypothetical protein
MTNRDYSAPLAARYVYGIQSGQFIKIGVATNVAQRMKAMRLLNPHPLKIVLKRRLCAAFYCEKKMHEILAQKAVGREWFEVSVEEVLAAAEIGAAYASGVHKERIARARVFEKVARGVHNEQIGDSETVVETIIYER